MVKRLALLFLAIIAFPVSAEVIAQVDRTEIYDDEPLNLTIRVSPVADLPQADLNALNSLFDIEQQFRQERRQIINGNRVSFVDYQFRLQPKETGTVTIPSFRIGNSQSQPILIRVLDSTQRQDGLADDAVLLTATVDQRDPFVDQPIILTVELAYKIQFRSGELSSFDPEQFETRLLDEGRSTRQINGTTYNLFRRVIELTPKQAGLFSLPDIRLTAEYPNQALGRYQRFSRKAETGSIQVRAIPQTYPAGAYWLPLTGLFLSDNLQNTNSLMTGEHLDWQLKLEADGTPAENLPPILAQIEEQLPPTVRLYRNPPVMEDGQRRESVALSFTEAGTVTLPDIRIPWWNVETDQLAWAHLPARTFNIQPDTSAAQTQEPQTEQSQDAARPTTTNMTDPEQPSSIIWISLTLLSTMGWLFTLIIWWMQSTRHRRYREKPDTGKQDVTSATVSAQYQTYLTLKRRFGDLPDVSSEETDLLNKLEEKVMAGCGEEPADRKTERLLQRIAKQQTVQKGANGSDYELYPVQR